MAWEMSELVVLTRAEVQQLLKLIAVLSGATPNSAGVAFPTGAGYQTIVDLQMRDLYYKLQEMDTKWQKEDA